MEVLLCAICAILRYIFHVIRILSIAKTNGKTEFPVERIQALDRKIIRHSVKKQLEVTKLRCKVEDTVSTSCVLTIATTAEAKLSISVSKTNFQ